MRIGRWIKRIVLGVVGLVIVAIAAVLIVIHTQYGRDLIATQINAKLDEVFVGGGSIGRIEGSPFGRLTLHDVVINGPDGKPALTAKKVTLGVGILPLVSKRAELSSVVAEDVEVVLKRGLDHELEATHMLKPVPSSGWSAEIPDLEIHRMHVAYDADTSWVNLDALDVVAALHAPFGGTLRANVAVRGAWRERAVGVGATGAIVADHGAISVPSLIVTAGAATVAAAGLRIAPAAGEVSGTVIVGAPAVAVAQLVPGVELPADVAIAATITPAAPWSHLSVIGDIGGAPVRVMLDADLVARRAIGVIAADGIDIAALSKGRLAGTGGGVVMFEARQGAAGTLPTARGVAQLWGDVADFPAAHAAIAFDTEGDVARTVVGVVGRDVRAMIEGEIARAGNALTLRRATAVASTANPAAASGGKAPVRGALTARLRASGALAPEPDLAVSGHIDGRRLRVRDLSVARLTLAIDARGLPRQPIGKAELALDDVMRSDMLLGELKVTAANRPDGKIQVSARSRPKRDPWLIDVDALVTPPGHGRTTIVDIQRHRVRAGDGSCWSGNSGHLEIGPRTIVLRGLHSRSARGSLDVEGELTRATGDFDANVAATGVALPLIDPAYAGTVDAHAAVTRRRGELSGLVDVKGRGVVVAAIGSPIDVDARVEAGPAKVTVAVTATGAQLGTAKLSADIAAPTNLADVAAWKRLDRAAIRSSELSFDGLDLPKLVQVFGRRDFAEGRLDGYLRLSADDAGGQLRVHLVPPSMRGGEGYNAVVGLAQSPTGDLQPTISGTINGFARFDASARIAVPARIFDPAAWKALGATVLRSATVRGSINQMQPWVLASAGLDSTVRGRAKFSADIAEGARSAQLAVEISDLQGLSVVTPLSVKLTAAIDGKGATTALSIRSSALTLFEVRGALPVTIQELAANPRAVLAAPLDVTATIPTVSTPALLAVFGRNEIIGGTLSGTIHLAGTLAAPTAKVHLVGTNLQAPPGPRGKAVKLVQTLTLDGTWDGTQIVGTVVGAEPGGSLHMALTANPKDLSRGTLTVQAKAFDMTPLLAFAPGPAGGAAGRLDANIRITGLDPQTARVVGEMHLDGGRVPIAPALGTLYRAKLDVVVREGSMKIDATGRLGGGEIKLASTFKLDGSMPSSGDVKMTLRKVSPIGAVEPDINADVTAKLTRKPDQWVADVFVKNGKVNVPSGRGEPLKPAGPPSDMVFKSGQRVSRRPTIKAPPRHAALVAHVTLYSTEIVSEELRGLIKGKVTISADANTIGIVGSIEADRGNIDLFGHRYQVEQAAVRFDGTTDPLLDLRITHDFPEVTTVTTVSGRLSDPDLVMTSDPGIYSQGQLLGFLLGGAPGGDPSRASMRDQATSVGASLVANKIRGYVKNALPIDLDVLTYEAATASSSAAVLVGSWLTSSIFVAYRQRLAARWDENRAEGEVEYWVSRRVSIEGTVGDRGYNGVDVLWRKRY